MADTIADVVLNNAAYTDIYATTGILSGTKLVLQNKEESEFILQTSASQPSSSSTDGVIMNPKGMVLVEAGENGLWAIGEGKLSVQEV